MADDDAKLGGDAQANPEQNNQQNRAGAADVWRKIEKASIKKQAKIDAKENLGEIKNEVQEKKHKRRRRRRKKPEEERSGSVAGISKLSEDQEKAEVAADLPEKLPEPEAEKASETIPELPVEPVPQSLPEQLPEAEPAASEEPINPFADSPPDQAPEMESTKPEEPINPFADSSPNQPYEPAVSPSESVVPSGPVMSSESVATPEPFNPFASEPTPPPYEYDRRQHASSANPEPFNPFANNAPVVEKKDQPIVDESKSVPEPINPFMPGAPAVEVPNTYLEEKPLDQVTETVPGVNDFRGEQTPENLGEAEEKNNGEEEDVFAPEMNLPENKTEVVDVTDRPSVSPSVPEIVPEKADVAEVDEFKSEFWNILEQAGITKKTVITVGIVIVLGLGAVLFFLLGGLQIFSGDGDGADAPVIENDNGAEDGDSDRDDGDDDGADVPVVKSISTDNFSEATGLIAAYVFGLEYRQDFTPIDAKPIGESGSLDGVIAAWEFGFPSLDVQGEFTEYMNLLRKMQNIYATDIYTLLDTSTSRRATLDNLLLEMDALINEGLKNYELINQRMVALDQEYGLMTEERDINEADFFNMAQNLNGTQSFQSLGQFIGSAQRAVEVKAVYNAYKLLRDMFANSINALRPRYQDIRVNSDALIEGVKVFDVKNSDIKAIIRLE